MAIVLIGGGARSGKSSYAMARAREAGNRRVYLATAQPLDREMAARIRRHREERGDDFTTIEEPVDLARAIASADCDALVVDCMTLWLSNIASAPRGAPLEELESVIRAAQASSAQIYFITNEVGCVIVPVTSLGRDFRDQSGLMNQRLAAAAGEVYFMVFGQPLRVK
jgi:adenosylcobinamide kinase/adenosylcobinamide-phosphate guanylyltransferase